MTAFTITAVYIGGIAAFVLFAASSVTAGITAVVTNGVNFTINF